MPIYEYQCDACGARIEAMRKVSDPPLRQCPECGKNKLRKLVSASAFRLKGSGWYETDFKKGGKKNLHGVSDGTDSKPAKAAEGAEAKDAKDKPAAKEKPAARTRTKKAAAD